MTAPVDPAAREVTSGGGMGGGQQKHWFACLVNRPASLGGPAPCDCNVTHGDCPRCPVHTHLCEHVCECAAYMAAGL